MAAVNRGVDRHTGAALLLADLPGVGPGDACRLIDRAGSPLAALEAAPGAPEIRSRGRAAAAQLRGRASRAADEAAARAARGLEPGDRLLRYGGPGYPERLRRLHAPPPVLWARGPLPAEAARAVAVVGTRAATPAGVCHARELGAGLAERGIRVVSGLARGIDGAAHRGALEAGGETAAVLGAGLRSRYPAENEDLFDRLRQEGLILTEFEPGVRAAPYNFPRRNRIVAGLCDAVVVVQAGLRSGALITVDRALEIGVEVCVFPGDVSLAASAGCHELLRDGAALVTGAADVLEVLGWKEPAPGAEEEVRPAPGEARVGASAVAMRLLTRIEEGPAGLDELLAIAGGVGPASLQLARLEMAGEIEVLPGGRFRRLRGPERERRAARHGATRTAGSA